MATSVSTTTNGFDPFALGGFAAAAVAVTADPILALIAEESRIRSLAIVAREVAVSGLRLAAVERGVVMGARDLGKLKTWAQTVAATLAGLQAAGLWDADIAWWALLIATILTWVSGLDYARVAPRVLRGERAAS